MVGYWLKNGYVTFGSLEYIKRMFSTYNDSSLSFAIDIATGAKVYADGPDEIVDDVEITEKVVGYIYNLYINCIRNANVSVDPQVELLKVMVPLLGFDRSYELCFPKDLYSWKGISVTDENGVLKVDVFDIPYNDLMDKVDEIYREKLDSVEISALFKYACNKYGSEGISALGSLLSMSTTDTAVRGNGNSLVEESVGIE